MKMNFENFLFYRVQTLETKRKNPDIIFALKIFHNLVDSEYCLALGSLNVIS